MNWNWLICVGLGLTGLADGAQVKVSRYGQDWWKKRVVEQAEGRRNLRAGTRWGRYGKAEHQEAGEGVRWKIRFVDGETGLPIERLKVAALEAVLCGSPENWGCWYGHGGQIGEVLTDEFGWARFDGEADGWPELSVERSHALSGGRVIGYGYAALDLPELLDGQYGYWTVKMDRGEVRKELLTAVDEMSGEAVAGARVSLVLPVENTGPGVDPWAWQRTKAGLGVTDRLGVLPIELGTGVRHPWLHVTAPGFADRWVSAYDPTDPGEIVMAQACSKDADPEEDGITARLQRSGSLGGSVALPGNLSQLGVPTVRVEWRSEHSLDGRKSVFYTVFDKKPKHWLCRTAEVSPMGEFEVLGLPPGVPLWVRVEVGGHLVHRTVEAVQVASGQTLAWDWGVEHGYSFRLHLPEGGGSASMVELFANADAGLGCGRSGPFGIKFREFYGDGPFLSSIGLFPTQVDGRVLRWEGLAAGRYQVCVRGPNHASEGYRVLGVEIDRDLVRIVEE